MKTNNKKNKGIHHGCIANRGEIWRAKYFISMI